MAAETNDKEVLPSFEVEGKTYDFPELGDLDLDEWGVVYKYSEVTIADLAPRDDDEEEQARVKRINSPLFTAALVHIAFQRAHPRKTYSTVKYEVGRIKMIPLLDQIAESMPDEDENPTSAMKPETSSSENSQENSEPSSPDSETSSETPEETPVSIGTSG